MYSLKVDASVDTIPVAFDATAGSLLSSSLPAGRKISIINETTGVIAFAVGRADSTPVTTLSTNRNQGFVPKAPANGTGGEVFDLKQITLGDKLYIRSDSGSPLSSGIVRITIW